jgi:hypothetical protein
MNNESSLDEIKQHISDYDHGRSKPPFDRNRFAGQIKSGFFLILIIPLIPIGIEFFLNALNPFYYVIMIGIGIHTILEIYNFMNYDHNKEKRKVKQWG